jgi:hypothetical protein
MPPYISVRKVNRQTKLQVTRDRNRFFSLTEQGLRKVGHMFYHARETEWNFDPSVNEARLNIKALIQEGYDQAMKENQCKTSMQSLSGSVARN